MILIVLQVLGLFMMVAYGVVVVGAIIHKVNIGAAKVGLFALGVTLFALRWLL